MKQDQQRTITTALEYMDAAVAELLVPASLAPRDYTRIQGRSYFFFLGFSL